MSPTRRQVLSAALGGALSTVGVVALSGCTSGASTSTTQVTLPSAGSASSSSSSGSVATNPVRHSYGSDPSQFGDLYRPSGTAKQGTVVLIHGGFWLSEYDLTLEQSLALDLVHRGYVVWNLEYRRVGDGGGWPSTFTDVAAGIDALSRLGVDTSHVVAIGHSAGGQLAAWAAGRGKLPSGAPGAKPVVTVTGVVSQAGVLSLAAAAQDGVGGTAVADLMGGSPADHPDRYRLADPIAAVPLTAPVLCVHAQADANVPYAQSLEYVAAAKQAGATATLATVPGDHFTLIEPTSPAWAAVITALPGLLAD